MFNTDLTLHWLHKNFQRFFTADTLNDVVVWDAYKSRIAEKVAQAVKKLSADLVRIPGGATSKIHSPDVSWNKSFKSSNVESLMIQEAIFALQVKIAL